MAKHGFPYQRAGQSGNCLRCGAKPPTDEIESAHDLHAIDVAIDFVTGMLEAKYEPWEQRRRLGPGHTS